MTAKVLSYYCIVGRSNPSDLVRKHWRLEPSTGGVVASVKTILFYSRNNGNYFTYWEVYFN